MFDLYSLLVFIHVLSAIVGLGPGFALIQVVSPAHSVPALQYAYKVRGRLHVFVMMGGTILLVTGLLMGALQPALFTTGWYIVSLILFFIALAMGPVVLAPKAKKIKSLLASCGDGEIPDRYESIARSLFRYERVESGVFLVIILLMVLKPI